MLANVPDEFLEGHELDKAAKKAPNGMIGRLPSRKEAMAQRGHGAFKDVGLAAFIFHKPVFHPASAPSSKHSQDEQSDVRGKEPVSRCSACRVP